MDILTEQDTFFGRTAYRNKLITQEQLSEAIALMRSEPGMRLGELMVKKGYISQEQVDAILGIQKRQIEILDSRKPPVIPSPSLPKTAQAVSVASARGVPAPLKVPEKLAHMADYLAYARAAGASDLHISPGARPFLRLYGRVHEMDVPPLAASETERLLFEILSMEQKSTLLAKLGLEFCLDVSGHGRYRACLIKQRLGFDGTFRVVNEHIPSFEELALPVCLRRLMEYTQGLVLVTGPANSGKTTTLAALLDLINTTRRDHIITVEKPIEYVHTAKSCQVTQREVGKHTRSFSHALRAALREDPDVIMVGELHDLETLEMAIAASETGHLVLGTLHTTSAPSTVSRMVDVFPVAQQNQVRITLSESLRGIVSQRLVPRKDGAGVALALEILLVTTAVAALLRDNKPFQLPSAMQMSRKMGMCRLDDSLQELVNAGMVDGYEAYQCASDKHIFGAYKPQ